MIHLGTLVLSGWGHVAPVGQFLHRPDWPAWSTTRAVDGTEATILGATVVDAEDLGRQALCLVTMNREKAPIICSEDTRFFSLDRAEDGRGEWVPISRLGVGETIRVPAVHTYIVPSWGKVKRIQRAPLPERLFLDANKMWGRLVLAKGAYSFPSPGAWVHT